MIVHSLYQSDYELKKTVLDGQEALVVPVVMMVEGVHNGSQGPTLHLAEELGKAAKAWNGMPVVVKHPQVEGVYVSAKGVEEKWVGRLYDVRVEGNKLKANAYIFVQKLAAIAPQALKAIQQKDALDVSIGVFNDTKKVAGVWGQEQYESIALNYTPDHLAILPGEKGACSWEDGCGIRVNEKKSQMTVCEMLKTLNEKGYASSPIRYETGYKEILEAVMYKLSMLDTETSYYMLEEIFKNDLVYSVRNMGTKDIDMYRVGYKYEKNKVEFTGDPQPVIKETSYINVMQRTKDGSINPSINTKTKKNMSEERVNPKVDSLIACSRTRFEESDRKWLLEQSDQTLDKLAPKDEPPVQVNKEKALEVLNLTKVEDYLDLMPDAMREKIDAGVKLYKEQREAMINSIVKNSDGVWEEDKLKEMDTEMLEKLNKTVQPKVDYSGSGAGNEGDPQVNVEEDDDLLMPAEEVVEKPKK